MSSIRGRASGHREQRDRVGRDFRIDGSDCQIVLQRLGHQQAVEGIAVERRQAGEVRHRSFVDRQAEYPMGVPLPRQEVGRRSRERQLAELYVMTASQIEATLR